MKSIHILEMIFNCNKKQTTSPLKKQTGNVFSFNTSVYW